MKKVIFSIFFTLLGVSLMAQLPSSIKLNLVKGKVYTVKSTSKQAIQQTVNGQTYNIDITSTSVTSFKVLKQENNVMDIEFKFDTIANKISSPMFTRETNSAKPAGNDPLEKIMNKMSQNTIIAKISTDGKFVDFVNYGKFKDNVMFVLDSIPAAKRDQAKTQADVLLKESAVKSMIEPLFAYLPEKPVKAGDTWETSFIQSANNVSMLCMNSFTLNSTDNNVAAVSGKSDIESIPSNDPNAKVTSELKGTITFDGTIDQATGLRLKNTSKGHIDGTNTMKNNGTEMKMPMVIDSQSEVIMSK
jgi:hypothetical protein